MDYEPASPPTQVTHIAVTLTNEADWERWFKMIHSVAMKYDIWEHIDPSTPKEDLPVLKLPAEPTPETIKAPASDQSLVRFSDLDSDEKHQLQTLQNQWMYKQRKYDRQKEALADLRTKILASIHPKHKVYVCTIDPL